MIRIYNIIKKERRITFFMKIRRLYGVKRQKRAELIKKKKVVR
jgi:hypothetical protein